MNTPSNNPENNNQTNLETIVQQLQQQVQVLSQQLIQNQNNNISVQTQPTYREPKLALPEKFNGNKKEIREFITSVNNYINLKRETYNEDYKKVGFIGSLLTGQARSWYRILVETSDECLEKYDTFLTNFKHIFMDPNQKQNAQRIIRTFKQDKQSALTYATKFVEYAIDAGFDNEAKISTFYNGLNNDIKDALALIPEVPADFSEFANLAIRVDNRLFERKMDRNSATNNKNQFSSFNTHNYSQENSKRNNNFKSNNNNNNSNSNGVQPMDMDITKKFKPLTNEEKERRRNNNLCLYCGNPGHVATVCPNKTKKFRRIKRHSTTIQSNDTTTASSITCENSKNFKEL